MPDNLGLAPSLDLAPFTPVVAAPASSQTTSGAPRLDAVGMRPRRTTPYTSAHTSPVQLHGGAFEPEGKEVVGAALGLRGGPQLTDHLQIGVMVDWIHRTFKNYTPVASPYSEAGSAITPERVIAEAKIDILPVMGFMQISTGGGFLVPYAGIAGGYEWLFLAAENFETDETFYANFGGWGWQGWAGLGLPLGTSVRLNGEVFYNGAIVERDRVDDLNETYQERVDLTGAGIRAGLFFGF